MSAVLGLGFDSEKADYRRLGALAPDSQPVEGWGVTAMGGRDPHGRQYLFFIDQKGLFSMMRKNSRWNNRNDPSNRKRERMDGVQPIPGSLLKGHAAIGSGTRDGRVWSWGQVSFNKSWQRALFSGEA